MSGGWSKRYRGDFTPPPSACNAIRTLAWSRVARFAVATGDYPLTSWNYWLNLPARLLLTYLSTARPPLSQRVHSEPDLSVVIAVGDQEDSIGHLIRNVASHLSQLGRSYEILIVNAGCGDNSLSIASVLAGSGTMPELEVLARDAAGRAFLRGASEARGDVVVLIDAGKPTSLAPLAWALSRLAAGRDAVVLRGRYVVARRLAVLPVIVRASGPGMLFEAVFERRAQELGIDIVGSRPRSPVPLLLRPVLRFLAA